MAEEVLQVEGMTLRGVTEGERPEVQYQHDWQPPPGTGKLYEGIERFHEQWLTPTTRSALQREVRYREKYVLDQNP